MIGDITITDNKNFCLENVVREWYERIMRYFTMNMWVSVFISYYVNFIRHKIDTFNVKNEIDENNNL